MAINRVGYLHVDVNVVRSAESAEVTLFFPCVLAPLAAKNCDQRCVLDGAILIATWYVFHIMRETAHPNVKNTRDNTHNQWFAELKSPRLGSAWRSGSGTYKLVRHCSGSARFRVQKKSSLLLYNGLKWPPFSSKL